MTHKGLTAQAESMTQCWHWTENDKILHVVSIATAVYICPGALACWLARKGVSSEGAELTTTGFAAAATSHSRRLERPAHSSL
jgi:hypothetical protein